MPLASNSFDRYCHVRNRDELHHCFTMLERSPHYDHSLTRAQVVSVWEDLLSQGLGGIDIAINPAFTYALKRERLLTGPRFLEVFSRLLDSGADVSLGPTRIGEYPPYFALHFSVYITEKYARYVISHPRLSLVMMDMLRRHYCFLRGEGESPICTVEAITEEKEKPPCVFCFGQLHEKLSPVCKAPGAVLANYADWLKDTSTQMYGGLSSPAWIIEIAGDYVTAAHNAAGQQLLRWDVSNVPPEAPEEQKDRNRYLLCTTASKAVSEQWELPADRHFHPELGSYLDSVFPKSARKASLSHYQRQIGFLLLLGYEKAEIAELLGKTQKNIRDEQRSMFEKLVNAGYTIPRNTPAHLVNLFRWNLHEIRPAIVPFYNKE